MIILVKKGKTAPCGERISMKIQFSQSYYQDTGENSILDAIAKTRYELENAYAGFDDATDPDLIDCYIYEVNSLLKRYRFLLHQAEEMNLFKTAQEPASDTAFGPISAIPVMQNGLFAISESEQKEDPLYEESPSGTVAI